MRVKPVALLCLLVVAPAALVSQGGLPRPESVFGFPPGADHKVATYDQVVEYFRRVDAASDRVTLVNAGETTLGRTFWFALVSSPGNLRNIDRLREIARRLAHPDALDEADARALAREGRPFVHIDGGLHSSELAAPQHTPALLYEILSRAGEPDMAAILDHVVLMLWPTINPDGHQMVAEWQMQHAPAPGGIPPLPRLYQEYVGHDNNRDAYMLNMIESRVMEHAWREWEPNIIYVHHQSAPFPTRIWLPPFAEPIATHAPYIVSREVNMIGMAIAKGLEERGQVGATHMGTGYDAWYPGYIDYMPVFKNIPAFWTETQGTGSAPRTSAPEDVRPDMRRPQSLYASPWLGGTWRFADAVSYMVTASLSVLDYASRYRETLLLNRYRSGRDQIQRGKASPYAYVFPEAQRDPVALAELLRRLAFNGVRVYRYREESTVDGLRYPAGTYVIPTAQPFAAVAREVLDVQQYPEIRDYPGGPLDQPYDAAGWTLPLAMGVEMVTATWPINYLALEPVAPPPEPRQVPTPYVTGSTDAAPFDSAPGLGFDASPAARAIVPPPRPIAGAGPALAVNPAENNAFRAVNQAWRAGASVGYVPAAGSGGARYVISGLPPAAQDALVAGLALGAERTTAAGTPVRRPRIGLYDVPTSMDQGWTRWVLDRFDFEYRSITGAEIQAGDLGRIVDVLLITDEPRGVLEGGGRGGARGGARGGGAGLTTPETQAANEARVRALDAFVRAGGTLVCLNRSSSFAIDQLRLPVRNIVAGMPNTEFAVNGSLLGVQVDTTQRVMSGMPGEAAVYFDRGGPVFETLDGFRGAVLARYQGTGSPLRSGFLLGETHLHGKAAALDVTLGDGRVILLGFRPQWRGQTFGTFKVIFNALIAR